MASVLGQQGEVLVHLAVEADGCCGDVVEWTGVTEVTRGGSGSSCHMLRVLNGNESWHRDEQHMGHVTCHEIQNEMT